MKRITNPMQEVAVDILTRISFIKNIDELDEIFKYVYEKYQLHVKSLKNIGDIPVIIKRRMK